MVKKEKKRKKERKEEEEEEEEEGHLRPHNKTFESLLLVLRCHQVVTADVLIADNNSAQCFITMTRQPPVGHGLIIYEVSRAQKTTRHIR